MRRRAPGGGRKPLKPDDRSSEILSVRIRPDVRRALQRLANKHRRSLSREMQRALESWIERHHSRPPHIEALSGIAAHLGSFVELFTCKRWVDDAFTAQAVVAALKRLIEFFDLAGVAKIPPHVGEDQKSLGEIAAFFLVATLAYREIKPEEFAAKIKSLQTDDLRAEFQALERLHRKLGSRKQIWERFIEDRIWQKTIEGEK